MCRLVGVAVIMPMAVCWPHGATSQLQQQPATEPQTRRRAAFEHNREGKKSKSLQLFQQKNCESLDLIRRHRSDCSSLLPRVLAGEQVKAEGTGRAYVGMGCALADSSLDIGLKPRPPRRLPFASPPILLSTCLRLSIYVHAQIKAEG
jgi:hypothetical protein